MPSLQCRLGKNVKRGEIWQVYIVDLPNLQKCEERGVKMSRSVVSLEDWKSRQFKKKYIKSSTGYTAKGYRVPHASDPIPENELYRIRDYFLFSGKTRYGLRNWILVLLGINVGLRCGDLTRLRIKDVVKDNEIKTGIEYTAEKTRSKGIMYIQDSLKPDLIEYIASLKDKSPSSWLFPSERGGPMRTNSVYKIFSRASKDLNLKFNFGTHSLRKSFGRNAYLQYGMDGAREVLRHRDNKSTMHYIGVTEDDIKEKALSLPVLGLND